MSQECLQVNTWLKSWFYDESEVDSLVSGKTVTVEKKSVADTGFLESYVVKQGGSQVGATINIPKDFLVKSGSVKTCSTADVPVSGYVVGDKYLDLVINTKDGTGSDEHLYILVSDLVDVPVDWSDVENKPNVLRLVSYTDYGSVYDLSTDFPPYNNLGYFAIVKQELYTVKVYSTGGTHPTITYTWESLTPKIADDLTTNMSNQVLSAKQGKVLKDLIDDLEDLIGDAILFINGTGGS